MVRFGQSWVIIRSKRKEKLSGIIGKLQAVTFNLRSFQDRKDSPFPIQAPHMKIILTILSFLIALPMLALEEPEPEPPAEKKEEAPKPKTHKVTKDTFKVEFEVDGIFMDAGASEVSIETKSWATLTVLEALPQGASVKKGQSLVKLDLEKIDEKIRDLHFEMELTTLDLQVAEADLQLLELLSPHLLHQGVTHLLFQNK